MANHPNRRPTASVRVLSKIAQAYERCKLARKALHKYATCMEVTEDKCGIVWERWSIETADGFRSLILFATPVWYDVFSPLTTDMRDEAVPEAIAAMAAKLA